MPILRKPTELEWTLHARAKMAHYRLTTSRIRRVLHSPKRIEEGVAPKTIAMMQPVTLKTSATAKTETWTQEIWVMVQDAGKVRKVISAWRYPGMTKPRGEIPNDFFEREYKEYLSKGAI